MSADFITSRVEINGPRHIWGPIRLSYHSSVCWLWLFGSCHRDSGWARGVIDQALLTDRWSMAVGGAMDLSFSPLSSSLFLPFSLASGTGAWCMWCFHEVDRMTDTSRRGGRLTGWLGDRHPHGGLTWTIHKHTHTHFFPPPHTFFHPFLCAECISRCHTDGLCTASMKTQPINDIRRSLFPPGDPVDLLLARVSLWITTVRETINQSSWKILTGFF